MSNVTFYSYIKETNLARKGGTYGNIFALSFKMTECVLSLRHQRALFLHNSAKEDESVKIRRDDICILLRRYRNTTEQIQDSKACKEIDLSDGAFFSAKRKFMRKYTEKEAYRKRAGVAIFSA